MSNQFLKTLELAKAVVEDSVLPFANKEMLACQLYLTHYKKFIRKNAGPKHSSIYWALRMQELNISHIS